MEKESEQTLLQKGHTDYQQTYEKTFNVTNHQKSANENHNEVLPQACQNGYHQ